MSHINEALKKAQKERDSRSFGYTGILLAGGRVRRRIGGRLLWGSLLLLGLILVGFTSYSWLDSRHKRTPAPPGPKPPLVAERQRSEVRAKTLYARAKQFHKTGRLKDARRFYLETLRVDPGYGEALNNLGVIYIQDRNYAAAKRTFEKAIRLSPDQVDPHYNLACLHAIKGELSLSLAHLRKAVSLDPSAKEWARRDTDLKNLRGVPEFESIVGEN